MSSVLVLVQGEEGAPQASSLESIGLALGLREIGAGRVTIGVVDPSPAGLRDAVSFAGVDEILLAPIESDYADPVALHQAAGALIDEAGSDVILVGGSVSASGWVPALAAGRGYGLATDVIEVGFDPAPVVRRPAYGGKLLAELEFDDGSPVILVPRAGIAEAPEELSGDIPVRELEPAPASGVERLGRTEADAGGVDITTASFLIAVGRGIEEEDDLEEFAELADSAGAMLCSSRPLVDAGWVEPSRQVGQSGRTVAPDVYLAFGISGAVQHLAGIRKADIIIAVNSDPSAPIFNAATYGAVADMYDVADELKELLG